MGDFDPVEKLAVAALVLIVVLALVGLFTMILPPRAGCIELPEEAGYTTLCYFGGCHFAFYGEEFQMECE